MKQTITTNRRLVFRERLEGAPTESTLALGNTTKLAEIDADGFDAIFYPGGHGPLWDLAENADSQHLIETFVADDRPLVAVCHAPAIFKYTKGADGKSLVSGRRVTGFTNTEEEAVGLTKMVPFLVEDMLKANGGSMKKARIGVLMLLSMASSSPDKIPHPQKLPRRRCSSSYSDKPLQCRREEEITC